MLGVIVAVVAAVLVGAPNAAAAREQTVVSALAWPSHLQAADVAVSWTAASGPTRRSVVLQHRTPGGTWRTALKARTGSNRLVPLRVTVTRAGSTWQWRVRARGSWTLAARTTGSSREWRVLVPRTASTTRAVSVPVTLRGVLSWPVSAVPLGPAVPSARSRVAVATGVTLSSYTHGRPADGYTVSALMAGRDSASLPVARTTLRAVRSAGFAARLELVVVPPVADAAAQVHAMVRVGRWSESQRSLAEARARALNSAGVPARVDFVGDDGLPTPGPWRLSVLEVDPRVFAGTCVSTLGRATATRERVSAMAADVDAVAGVNGGFFSIDAAAAYRGDPTGVAVASGELLSEAIPGRTALVLDGCQAAVTQVTTAMSVTVAGATRPVQGVNRPAGDDEIVVMTDDVGVPTPDNGGLDVVLAATGRVLALRPAGDEVASGQRVLHAVGAAATWLRSRAVVGATVSVDVVVRDDRRGTPIALTASTHVIGGLVELVRDGREHIAAARDGHASIGMVLRRHPRTLAGVRADGSLVLVVVDGRDPGTTVGASFVEAARLMRWLGAQHAVSLDGGGSSTMVVEDDVVNRPSDGAERAVGDALLVVPG